MIKLQSPAESRALPDGYADRDASHQWHALAAVEIVRDVRAYASGFREVEIEFKAAEGHEVTFYTVIVDTSDGGALLPHPLAFDDSDILWRAFGEPWIGLESTIERALMFGVSC